jgi:hypothetical protein
MIRTNLGFSKRRDPYREFVGDGAGAANQRSAVAAADWESVGGAWSPGPEWSSTLQGLDRRQGSRAQGGIVGILRIARMGAPEITDDILSSGMCRLVTHHMHARKLSSSLANPH